MLSNEDRPGLMPPDEKLLLLLLLGVGLLPEEKLLPPLGVADLPVDENPLLPLDVAGLLFCFTLVVGRLVYDDRPLLNERLLLLNEDLPLLLLLRDPANISPLMSILVASVIASNLFIRFLLPEC